jgi:beta-lactamase class A
MRHALKIAALLIGFQAAGAFGQARAPERSDRRAADRRAPDPNADVLRDKLQTRLSEIAERLDGVMGYAIVDLTTNDRFGARDEEVFPTASTIKLGILYELFVQADAGTVRLDDPQPLPDAARVGGSGLVNELTAPRLSLRDHAILMMLISDNTSTNVVIDALGLPRIQARLDGLGLKQTKLRRRMMDTDAAKRGDENVSTPAELTRILTRFHTGEGLSPRSKDDALAILTKAKSTAMTRVLPEGVKVASKPGGLDGVRVDAGLVLLPNRPYIFVAMCTYLKDDDAGDRAIGEASRAVFDYFDRIGAEGVRGRRIR